MVITAASCLNSYTPSTVAVLAGDSDISIGVMTVRSKNEKNYEETFASTIRY